MRAVPHRSLIVRAFVLDRTACWGDDVDGSGRKMHDRPELADGIVTGRAVAKKGEIRGDSCAGGCSDQQGCEEETRHAANASSRRKPAMSALAASAATSRPPRSK